MNEHSKWFWRMSEDERDEAGDKFINQWFFSYLARFARKCPIGFARIQFDLDMDNLSL